MCGGGGNASFCQPFSSLMALIPGSNKIVMPDPDSFPKVYPLSCVQEGQKIVRLILRSLEMYPAPFESPPLTSTLDPSGDFVFPSVLEGRYSVNATALPANSYVADVRMQ